MPRIRETAYNTLVRPQLEYASAVWDPQTKDKVNQIKMVQRRAARCAVKHQKVVVCEDCKKRFHATCSELGNEAFEKKNESGIDTWYCADCKADCGLSSHAVLNGHKAVQCDSCEMWIHNEWSYISLGEYETLENTNCSWICPKCEVLNFSDSYFDSQRNFEQSNKFDPLVKDMNKAHLLHLALTKQNP